MVFSVTLLYATGDLQNKGILSPRLFILRY